MQRVNLLLLILLIYNAQIFAVRESREIGLDSRIRVMVYHPNEVFKFIGHYNYQASIELGKEEEVVSISMGDTTGWQIVPSGNRILIKPTEHDANTNMTVITDKRTYFFELYAEEALDIRDPNMVFNVRFIYPDEEENVNLKRYAKSSALPDLSHPEKYNFRYSISGDDEISPVKIFDDGEFTYLQFRDKNAEMPALFAVDEELREAMVNYHISPDNKNMIVIEGVFAKLSARNNKKLVCIFNEAFKP